MFANFQIHFVGRRKNYLGSKFVYKSPPVASNFHQEISTKRFDFLVRKKF